MSKCEQKTNRKSKQKGVEKERVEIKTYYIYI